MTYESAVDLCRDLDIPEDAIDEVIESAELCNCGDEGPCQENSEAIISAAAEKYQVTSQTSPTPTYAQIALIAMFGLFIAAFMVQMARSGDASLQRNYEGIRAEMRRAQ